MPDPTIPPILFSDYFGVAESEIEAYGAFNACLISDLPLFIDPFLLFNSEKQDYQKLHGEIIDYLVFLYQKSTTTSPGKGELEAWYHFKEVKQTWLGFTASGNAGHGLAQTFAKALNKNFKLLFNPSQISVTKSFHLEKLGLIEKGVGRDTISDFTTNLIKHYLLEYTQEFARTKIDKKFVKRFPVAKAKFNYNTETWATLPFDLPFHANLANYSAGNKRQSGDNYVILVPTDLLTRHEAWINKADMLNSFDLIADSLPDDALRASVNNYLAKAIEKAKKQNADRKQDEAERRAIQETFREFPVLIDYFIKRREELGEEAVSSSSKKVYQAEMLFLAKFINFVSYMATETPFYKHGITTVQDASDRVRILKNAIERDGVGSFFYKTDKQPISSEEDLRVAHRLLWFNQNGFEPDTKASKEDIIKVEFKLASNNSVSQFIKAANEKLKEADEKGEKNESIIVLFAFNGADRQKAEEHQKESINGKARVFVIDASPPQILRKSLGTEDTKKQKENNNMPKRKKDQIFISYSHADAKWLDEFEKHLKPFDRAGKLSVWDDKKIRASQKWKDEIQKALDTSGVALFLVSPTFLASDFISDEEMPAMLKAAEEEGVLIFWVPVRSSAYKTTFLKDLQSRPGPDKPLAGMSTAKRDTVMVDICSEIAEIINESLN
ncbi:hypothetical protein IAD21_02136 [Abditibacteriota bacterium]|nr:hypothetical protein IAD21_02136 [Abditibacteriota bacterium]